MSDGKFEELFERIGCGKERTSILEWNDFIFRAAGDQHRRGNRAEAFPRIVTDARQPPYRKIWVELLGFLFKGQHGLVAQGAQQ